MIPNALHKWKSAVRDDWCFERALSSIFRHATYSWRYHKQDFLFWGAFHSQNHKDLLLMAISARPYPKVHIYKYPIHEGPG